MEERETIEIIARKYLEIKSLTGLETYLIKHNIVSRTGVYFCTSRLRAILTNLVYATYDENTNSGSDSQVKVKSTIHWLNQKHAKNVEVRLFDNLVADESKELVEGQEHAVNGFVLNPNSLTILNNSYVEDGVDFNFEDRYQFLRNGYFALDKDTTKDKLVFNKTIGLKDTYKPQQ